MTNDNTPFWQKPALRVVRVILGVVVLLIPGLQVSYLSIEAIVDVKNPLGEGFLLFLIMLFGLALGVVLTIAGLGITISAIRTKDNTRVVAEKDSPSDS